MSYQNEDDLTLKVFSEYLRKHPCSKADSNNLLELFSSSIGERALRNNLKKMNIHLSKLVEYSKNKTNKDKPKKVQILFRDGFSVEKIPLAFFDYDFLYLVLKKRTVGGVIKTLERDFNEYESSHLEYLNKPSKDTIIKLNDSIKSIRRSLEVYEVSSKERVISSIIEYTFQVTRSLFVRLEKIDENDSLRKRDFSLLHYVVFNQIRQRSPLLFNLVLEDIQNKLRAIDYDEQILVKFHSDKLIDGFKDVKQKFKRSVLCKHFRNIIVKDKELTEFEKEKISKKIASFFEDCLRKTQSSIVGLSLEDEFLSSSEKKITNWVIDFMFTEMLKALGVTFVKIRGWDKIKNQVNYSNKQENSYEGFDEIILLGKEFGKFFTRDNYKMFLILINSLSEDNQIKSA